MKDEYEERDKQRGVGFFNEEDCDITQTYEDYPDSYPNNTRFVSCNTITLEKANAKVAEFLAKGKVVYSDCPKQSLWIDHHDDTDTHTALLINIQPIEQDSAEKILRDFKEKCDKLEYHPGSFTRLDLTDLYERAKAILARKKK